MSTKSVILIGASGNVGSVVTAELLTQRSKFDRVAILADPAKVDKFADAKAKGVEIVVGLFLDSSSFKGFDIAISLLGSQAISQQPALIDAAVSAGVMHVYLSEMGLDFGQPYFVDEFFFQHKLATRRHAAATAEKNPAFGFTSLMTGMVTEFVVLTPLFGVDKEKKVVDFVGREKSRISFTAMPDIARFIVSSLFTAGPGKRELRVQGETVTAGQCFLTLSKVQGIDYQVGYTPVEKAKELQVNLEKEGNLPLAGLMNLRQAVGARGWLEGNDNGQFNFKPETIEETFRRLSS